MFAPFSDPGSDENRSPEVSERDPKKDLKDQVDYIPYNKKREINRSNFELEEKIGWGNFGNVHKGYIKNLGKEGSQIVVAIKTIQKHAKEEDLNDLLCEIKLMSRIKPHPNLVSMIGSCHSEYKRSRQLWLLIEFCEYGDLKKCLFNNKDKIAFGKETDKMNSRYLLMCIYQVAKGMLYLAESRIMHGDLAARNVLMAEHPLAGESPIAKIADFGLSKKLYTNERYNKKSRLLVPWKWMAIEYLTNDFFTLKSDVWSFAVLVWEVLSFGGSPYGQQSYEDVFEQLVDRGYRLQCPKEVKLCQVWSPEELYNELTEVCFLTEPEKRASFSDVIKILEAHLSLDEKESYSKLCDIYDKTKTEKYLAIQKSTR